MGKFIEELYYGNIDPQARSAKQKVDTKRGNGIAVAMPFLTKSSMLFYAGRPHGQ